jgi:3-dehydro-4-phosphotetronate decarboxylase
MNEREAMVECGLTLHERGFSAGNLSMRVENGFLLTPTNVSLGALDPARLSRLSHDGRHVDGDTPTREAFLHLALYAERPDANAIVQLRSTYAVAVSCLEGLDADDALPPLTPSYVMRVGRLPLVPYARPGDAELAEHVRLRARESGALLLANHGPIVAAASLDAATSAIAEIEETARLVLLTWGLPVRQLSRSQAAELRQPAS